jgi:2'-deoxynucleoside 5'-phosphate N-hydrolase
VLEPAAAQNNKAGRFSTDAVESLGLASLNANVERLSPVGYLRIMRIYFGFTVAGDRSTVDTARKVVQLLEERGHEVLTRHLVSDNAWEADRAISPQDVFRRDMAWLNQCDLFVAEVSGSSFGLGFEAGYLLGATDKKVILLYRRDLETRVSLLITGNTHANCILAPYSNVGEVEKFVSAHIQDRRPEREAFAP